MLNFSHMRSLPTDLQDKLNVLKLTGFIIYIPLLQI